MEPKKDKDLAYIAGELVIAVLSLCIMVCVVAFTIRALLWLF